MFCSALVPLSLGRQLAMLLGTFPSEQRRLLAMHKSLNFLLGLHLDLWSWHHQKTVGSQWWYYVCIAALQSERPCSQPLSRSEEFSTRQIYNSKHDASTYIAFSITMSLTVAPRLINHQVRQKACLVLQELMTTKQIKI